MKLHPNPIPGVFEISVEPHQDERGCFARLYCPETIAAAKIDFTSTQINLSTNAKKHTLRGVHFQQPPFAEAKIVRCVQGRVWDVAVDLRAGPTYGHWQSFELSAAQLNAVHIPEGVAHGFLTLEDETHLLYQMGRPYEHGHARGIRWDDADLAIEWPAAPKVISEVDLNWPSWRELLP